MLLDRLQLLGDGGGEAAGRRDWANRIEMQAQAVCLWQGISIVQHGFGKLNRSKTYVII